MSMIAEYSIYKSNKKKCDQLQIDILSLKDTDLIKIEKPKRFGNVIRFEVVQYFQFSEIGHIHRIDIDTKFNNIILTHYLNDYFLKEVLKLLGLANIYSINERVNCYDYDYYMKMFICDNCKQEFNDRGAKYINQLGRLCKKCFEKTTTDNMKYPILLRN